MEILMSVSIVVELFIATMMFCRHAGHPHMERLWLLLVGCVACCVVFLGMVSVLGGLPFSQVVLATLFYLLAFLAAVVTVAYLFELAPLEALVVGTLGYSTQHLWSDVGNVLLGEAFVGMSNDLAYYLVHLAILVGGYVLTYWLLARHFQIDAAVVERRAWWIVASFLAIFFVIVCTMVFADAQQGMARLVCYVYDALCTLLIMIALMLASRVDGLRFRLAKQEALWEQKRQQYETTRESMDLINVKCHDIRKKVNAMGREAALSSESLKKIHDTINVYDAGVKTGDDALDVVLSQKRLLCSQRGIELDCLADGGALGFMEADDLYFLMANILDNAIEAVLSLDDPERRSIDLTVRQQGGFAVIREDNFFGGELHFDADGLPHTTKADAANHGFGTRSIRRCVNDYGGEMSMRAKDGVFTLVITLPLPFTLLV